MSNSSHDSAIRPHLLFIGEIEEAHEQWDDLHNIAGIIQIKTSLPKWFEEYCQTEELAGVNVIIRTFNSTKMTGPFDKPLLDLLPQSVKYICHIGAGYDSVDAVACAERGIAVSNTPGVTNEPTACHAVTLILICFRNLQIPYKALRAGEWQGKSKFGCTPRGKILGIWGMGGIGQEVAKRMVAFGMRIQYHNRTPLPDGKNPTSATYVSFEGLLRTSDVISVHVPLNQSTRHGIGAEELEKMKPGAILINTARGSILDEGAVALALEQNQLSSVGLDVFEKEPDVHEDLRRNDRCFLTPHIGAATVDTQRSMETVALRNASTAILSGRLETPVAESKEVEEKVATEEECSV